MGSVSRLPAFNPDQNYSDAELRLIACEYYCTLAGGNHLPRIARKVGKPLAVIQQWHQEDKWTLRRATIQATQQDEKVAELARTLAQAGVKDSKEDALETLKLCQDAKAIVQRHIRALLDKGYISGSPEHPDHARFLRQVLICLEQIDKLSVAAYDRL